MHAEKVLLDPAMNQEILALGADKGVQVVSVYTFAPAHYFGKQPLRKLDDFKGKKLRVNATAAERAKMRQFGASAVPMDLSEVVPGIQQGVIDGTMSAAAVYVNLKFMTSQVLTEGRNHIGRSGWSAVRGSPSFRRICARSWSRRATSCRRESIRSRA